MVSTQVDADDPSMSDALEFARPYRQYNIYETYPEAIVEVRAYCLKAFQVTRNTLATLEQHTSNTLATL